MTTSIIKASLFAAFTLCISTFVVAQDKPAADDKPTEIKLSDGEFLLTAPSEWEQQEPSNRIIEFEFAIPAVEGDKADGRLTIMEAGGSVDDNISRWIGQFSQPDGKSTRDRAKIEEEMIAGQKVHKVTISGTFTDRRGPFGPAEVKENYTMLGAIVVTQNRGKQFIKLYGPTKTIEAHENEFEQFLDSLQVKGKN